MSNGPSDKAISGKSKSLLFSQYEKLTSRLFSTQISADNLSEVRNGKLTLKIDRDNVRFWSTCLTDDLILLLCAHEKILLACRITGKAIRVENNPLSATSRGLIIHLEVCGEGSITRVSAPFYFETISSFATLSHSTFSALWEQCDPTGAARPPSVTSRRVRLSSDGKYEVRFASSQDDLKFVSEISEFHPFGGATASVTLIATEAGRRVGALLAEFSRNQNRHHAAPWRVFGSQYSTIRPNALFIVRLYADPSANAKFRIHDALVDTLEHIAPSILNEPITIIESISYDFHPLAPGRGYRIELPRSVEGTFYYWKPFYTPAIDNFDYDPIKLAVKEAHGILRARENFRYWLAPGTRDRIQIGLEKQAWAIRQGSPNTGLWHMLRAGDVIFFKDQNSFIVGYGMVKSTRRNHVPGYEQYPLWIDLEHVVRDVAINVTSHIEAAWYERRAKGGLIHLPSEFGAALKLETDSISKGRKMWVHPNPYLLHRTSFEVRPKQVFVVQAFELSTTVLVAIRDGLASDGYAVKYSGDRSGQVIFEDIWLMLNESEIVIVDFTHRRPNVYLEYGMALVLGKPIIAITQNKEDLPTDTPELKYIMYNDKLGDRTLVDALPRAIRDTIEDIERAHLSPAAPLGR